MSPVRFPAQRSAWYAMLITLAICGLTVNLAGRTFHFGADHVVCVQSQSSQVKRQQMNRDADGWVAPVVKVTVLEVVSFSPRVAPAGPPIPNVFFDESLFYRPPPSY